MTTKKNKKQNNREYLAVEISPTPNWSRLNELKWKKQKQKGFHLCIYRGDLMWETP